MKTTTLILLTVLFTTTACVTGSRTPTPASAPLETDRPTPGPAAARPLPTPIPYPSPTPIVTSPAPPPLNFFTPTPLPATPRVEVIVMALNLRAGPGTGYPVIGEAVAGDVFTVVGVDPSGEWLQIAAGNGSPAWVSADPAYTRLRGVSLSDLSYVEPPAAGTSAAGAPAAVPTTDESPSGSLVFTTGSGGDLYVVNVDGSGLRRLTGGVIDPVVSPDGRQAAFTRWDGAGLGGVYVINLDGSGERLVAADIRRPKAPAWSPDGSQLVISFQHGGRVDPDEICKEYDLDDRVRLPDDIAEITKFRVGADGISVCYILKEDLQWGLRRIEVATGRFEDLPVGLYSRTPAWDPQQPWRVVYAGDRGLMQFDVTSGGLWPITTDVRDTAPVFSPDGRMLALTYRQHDHWEVYTFDLQTRARHRLTEPPLLADPQYNSAAPAWSPDGRYLAFLTDRAGRWEIWVMEANGNNQQPLLPSHFYTRVSLQYRGMNERMLGWVE